MEKQRDKLWSKAELEAWRNKGLKAIKSGSPTAMFEAMYPQLATLDSQLKGELPDEKVLEIAEFKDGKLFVLSETTKASPFMTKKAYFKSLKRNPKRELLGTVKGKGFETLKLSAYYKKPLNEISRFKDNAKRGLLVAGGGVHPIFFSLDFIETVRLINILQRLKYRLRRREKPEKLKNIVKATTRYGGRAWKADKEAE